MFADERTELIYSRSIDPMTFQIVATDSADEQLYSEFTALKSSR